MEALSSCGPKCLWRRGLNRRHFLNAGALIVAPADAIAAAGANEVVGELPEAVFATVANLQSAHISDETNTVRTNGYHSPNGKGAALYRRKSPSEADEPGQQRSNDSSVRWGYAGGSVDVYAFGATGDGITDDTAAIKRAQDYARLTRKPVVWGAGRFLLSDTIVFPRDIEQLGAGGGEWRAWAAVLRKILHRPS